MPERSEADRVRLHDLIAEQILPPNALLEATVDGVSYRALLRPDGTIEVDASQHRGSMVDLLARVRANVPTARWHYKGRSLAELSNQLPPADG